MPSAQVAAKQRVLEDNLERLGKVTPGQILPPVIGPAWGYRNRARALGALRREEGRRAGGIPRAALELRGRHHVVRGDAAVHLGADPGAARDVHLDAAARSPPAGGARDRRGGDGAGAAPPGADSRGGCGEAARLRRSPRHPVVAAAQGSGDRAPVLSARQARARLPAAGIRTDPGVRPDGVHPGQRGREPRAREARGGPAGPASRRARGRPLLRAGQLLAGARHARRGGGRHRGRAVAGRAGAGERTRQRARGPRHVFRARSLYGCAGSSRPASAASTSC